ncbi:MAG: hypothetical protein KGI52_03690, partial [Burkholderiales bacterium]|nr:hypothetical protein [Burkholderiales bacterium]
LAASYRGDLYNRVLVRPASISLGALASRAVQTVEVWNAWLVANTLSSIVASGGEGLTFAGPAPAPTTFGPLESRNYTLTADVNGPPTIAASYALAFTTETRQLTVTGLRVIGWPDGPNWAQPVLERLQWQTSVLRARSGAEQRVRLRAAPRRSWQYTGLRPNDAQRVQQENMLRAWQARVYAMPVWTDGQYLTAPVAAGATGVSLDTTLRDYTVGGLLALRDAQGMFIGRVASVSAGSLTLSSPVDRAYAAPVLAAPARPARLQNPATLQYVTDAVLQFAPQWQQLDAWAELTPTTETADYRGLPVLATRTDWAPSPTLPVDVARDLAVFDPGTGTWGVDDLSGVSTAVRTHHWLLNGRQAIADFRAWLAARAGRLNPFWLPSGQSDAQPLAVSGAALTVAGQSYATLLSGASGRRDLMIVLTDGTRQYRRIASAVDNGDGTETWTLDAVPSPVYVLAQIASLQFMMPVRLDADQVEIAYETDSIARATLRLRTVAGL